MPEFVHAQRGLEGTLRKPIMINLTSGFKVGFAPWPYSSTCLLTFDCEGTYGGGQTTDGETVLVPEFSKLFSELGIKATFNFTGKIAEDFPEVLKIVKKYSHDISGHGYSHNHLDGLSLQEQKEELEKTIEAISLACDYKICGLRAPFGSFDKNTYVALTDLGFKWTSNFGRSLWGDVPFIVSIDNHKFPIVDIPFDDIHFDSWIYKRHNIDFEQAFLLYKNHLYVTGLNNSIFTLLSHPAGLAVDPGRAEVIRRFAEYISQQKHLWAPSSHEVATRCRILDNISFIIEKTQKYSKSIRNRFRVYNENSFDISDLTVVVNLHKKSNKIKYRNNWYYDEHSVETKTKAVLEIPKIKAMNSKTIDLEICF